MVTSIDTQTHSHIDSAMAEVRGAAYDVPLVVGGAEVRTGRTMPVVTPHAHATVLGQVHRAGPAETTAAIDAALAASRTWSRLSPEERTAPFLRAMDLLERSPWRERLVAATMLELSKTCNQAEGEVVHRGVVERRHGEDEALQRAVVQLVDDTGRRRRLHAGDVEEVRDAGPHHVGRLGDHVALGLGARLRQLEHRRGDEPFAPRAALEQ
ncbi:MAG: aldehyde dehydrogenase family protein, partial [Propionibacteriaceae bacterium]